MQRFHKLTPTAGQLCALGVFVLTLALQGCISTNVTCGDADGGPGPGRGACLPGTYSGVQVNGVTCTGGVACASSGAPCSRSNPLMKCTTIMPQGGTVCACDCRQ